MSWNNGNERKKFDDTQEMLQKEYRAVGMTEEQITSMYEFDLNVFKSDRRFYEHTQPLSSSNFSDNDEDDSESTLLSKFRCELSVSIEDSNDYSRFWWIDELEDPRLIEKIKELNCSDLELLSMFVFEGYSQKDLSVHFEISQQAISKKLKKIFTFISEWL